MSALFVELGGQHIRLSECDWVWWGACGCPYGVTVGRYSPTEEAAWKQFYSRKRDVGPAQRRGERMELMTHDRYRNEVVDLMRKRCMHRDGVTS